MGKLQEYLEATAPKRKPQRYNHLFSIGFSVETTVKDPASVPVAELVRALFASLAERAAHDDFHEAFGYMNDTFEVEDPDPIEKRRIVTITVEGGVVQDVEAPADVDVVVIDLDELRAYDEAKHGPRMANPNPEGTR